MAIMHNLPNKTQFADEIVNIINNNIKTYKYKNISSVNFITTYIINSNRIHIRTNFSSKLKNDSEFHIFELSFWLNGKISDNFTINDFFKNPLYLYENKELYYYLLPIELLVSTTLYAIVDFYERRNFNKCIKYIERVKIIKKTYDTYEILPSPSDELVYILAKYKNKIKRKYKFINDYPFLTSYYFNSITNKKLIKCIYRKMRVENRKNLFNYMKLYNEECKKYIPFKNDNDSENTQLSTDDEAKNKI